MPKNQTNKVSQGPMMYIQTMMKIRKVNYQESSALNTTNPDTQTSTSYKVSSIIPFKMFPDKEDKTHKKNTTVPIDRLVKKLKRWRHSFVTDPQEKT